MGKSIEGELESTLCKVLRQCVTLQAASRTDAGVHAEKQVINFFLQSPLQDLPYWSYRFNSCLPRDIRILSMEEQPIDFHPTLNAKKKQYTYWICNSPVQSPFLRHLSWHVPQPLDIPLIHAAMPHLLGTHDFSSFCNDRALFLRSPICTLTALHITPMPDSRFHLMIEGDHFLYRMARNIAGTLVDVGRKKISTDHFRSILKAQNRTLAGITAPAHGLRLSSVLY